MNVALIFQRRLTGNIRHISSVRSQAPAILAPGPFAVPLSPVSEEPRSCNNALSNGSGETRLGILFIGLWMQITRTLYYLLIYHLLAKGWQKSSICFIGIHYAVNLSLRWATQKGFSG